MVLQLAGRPHLPLGVGGVDVAALTLPPSGVFLVTERLLGTDDPTRLRTARALRCHYALLRMSVRVDLRL